MCSGSGSDEPEEVWAHCVESLPVSELKRSPEKREKLRSYSRQGQLVHNDRQVAQTTHPIVTISIFCPIIH